MNRTAKGVSCGARVALDTLETLDTLTLIGKEWHGLSTVFVTGWHKATFFLLDTLTTVGNGWHARCHRLATPCQPGFRGAGAHRR